MHTVKGIVESIEGGWAWVLTRRTGACSHCSQNNLCHMVEGMDRMVVKAKNPARARKGDEVELYLSTKTKLKGLFILYMFPVLGLLIGAFSGNSLSGVLGLHKELGIVLFTLSGLILAFLMARYVAHRMDARGQLTPIISRVLRRAISSGPPLKPHATGPACDLSRECIHCIST